MPVLPSYRNQLIRKSNQLTGFYMRATLAFNELITIQISDHLPILTRIKNIYQEAATTKTESYLMLHFDLNLKFGTFLIQ